MLTPRFANMAFLAALLAFLVVVLGAYVRLSDAGLGCPDWPGCYGELSVPRSEEAVRQANEAFPHRQLESGKAWKEMIHRYAAGVLGLLIAGLGLWAWRERSRGAPFGTALFLVGLVVFQALLGMWTVTLLLKPLVVMAHLLGGLTIFSVLLWMGLRSGTRRPARVVSGWRLPALLALIVVVAQIALGGWTSSNYAALACPDFPRCQGAWWPDMNLEEGFRLWRGLGIDYEFGVLDNSARVAIHVVHRLGAVLTLLYVGLVALSIGVSSRALRVPAMLVGLALIIQIGLGIANVVYYLPLAVAVAHNAGAALLLASIVYLNHRVWPQRN